MYYKGLIKGLAAIAVLGMSIAGLVAEEEANLHRMYHIQLKQGKAADFYNALGEHAAWRREQGDPWTWLVHQVDTGEHAGDCVIRSGGLKWSDMDGYDEFGAKGSEKFWETVGKYTEDSSSWITAMDSRFTRYHPNQDKVRLVNVIDYELYPNKGEDFAKAVQVYHDAIMEHDYPTYYAFDWMVSGGTHGSVSLVLFFENWADMAPNEEDLEAFIVRVLGEDKAKEANEAFEACVKSSRSTIVRFIPELSIVHEE